MQEEDWCVLSMGTSGGGTLYLNIRHYMRARCICSFCIAGVFLSQTIGVMLIMSSFISLLITSTLVAVTYATPSGLRRPRNGKTLFFLNNTVKKSFCFDVNIFSFFHPDLMAFQFYWRVYSALPLALAFPV